ncbi:C-type mannose receptor 2-like isoform X1 [Clavelina lepadiformis]|uniref:C-type mannose receptor 2-like isoform X1 n=1 Tax=Clavelina lepadiformis TaxID=159417 RepID=UPI004041CFAB
MTMIRIALVISVGCVLQINHAAASWQLTDNGFEYRQTSEKHSWQDARSECIEMGGDLAVHGMKDLAMRESIGEMITFTQVWIGFTDLEEEGAWKWLDGDQYDPSYDHWYPGRPSGDRDCAFISPGKDYKTVDRACDDNEYHLRGLCEKGTSIVLEEPEQVQPAAEINWHLADNGLEYIQTSEKHSWQDARSECIEMGGDLAVYGMKDLSMREAIGEMIPFTQVWIGFTDLEEEGAWRWLDGDQYDPSYDHWYPGRPSGDKDCAFISPGKDYKTVDRACDNNEYYLRGLCEKGSPIKKVGFSAPTGWYMAENGLEYKLSDKNIDWNGAREACRDLKSALAVQGMKDLEMRSTIANALSITDAWIGLNDEKTEATWMWLDGEQDDASLSHWIESFSLQSDGKHIENCARISSSNEYRTFPYKCGYRYKALCEKGVDICSTKVANCHADATCHNVDGSFSCTCNHGFHGDGVTCRVDRPWYNPGNGYEYNVKEDVNWEDGRKQCQSEGADLSSEGMKNLDIRNQIADALLKPYPANNVWFGVKADYYLFKWISDGTRATDNGHWYSSNEPNGPTWTRCAALLHNQNYLAASESCSDKWDALCERDIDECSKNTHNCNENAECTNIPGSFKCTCNDDYSGDGVYCEVGNALGWFVAGNGFEYKLTRREQSWEESRTVCQQMGGDLATKGFETLSERGPIAEEVGVNKAWIGMNDLDRERDWKFIDDTISVHKARIPEIWKDGFNLKDEAANEQDCGFIAKADDYKTDDSDCSAARYGLCQREATNEISCKKFSWTVGKSCDERVFGPDVRHDTRFYVASNGYDYFITDDEEEFSSAEGVCATKKTGSSLALALLGDDKTRSKVVEIFLESLGVDKAWVGGGRDCTALRADNSETEVETCTSRRRILCEKEIDECARKQDDCGENAACTNTIGSFTCACKPGYEGDGHKCTKIEVYRASNGYEYSLTSSLEYDRTKGECDDKGGDLAVDGIKDNDVRLEIADVLLRPFGITHTWVGLRKSFKASSWTWSDESTGGDEINWYPGQPSSGTHDCAFLLGSGDAEFRMGATRCRTASYVGLCEVST